MWPGLVGKSAVAGEPPLSLDRMLDLTLQASVGGQRFDGIDLFLSEPHVPLTSGDDAFRSWADRIAARGLCIGTLVAPVWPWTGGGSAMGTTAERRRFVDAVRRACGVAQLLNEHGVRADRLIRIDSADSPARFAADPAENRRRIIDTFREAARVADDHGEQLVAEGEICWAGMQSWREMVRILEGVGRPESLGFQADLSHTYFYLRDSAAPGGALLPENHTREEFDTAYAQLVAALGPWTLDVHVAQTDGTLHGSGEHDRTGRHSPPQDPRGRLEVAACTLRWLSDGRGNLRNNIRHVCWDGCMFPNAVLETPETWNQVLGLLVAIREGLQLEQQNTTAGQ